MKIYLLISRNYYEGGGQEYNAFDSLKKCKDCAKEKYKLSVRNWSASDNGCYFYDGKINTLEIPGGFDDFEIRLLEVN